MTLADETSVTSTDATDVPLDALRTVLAPLGTVVSAERLTGGMFATSYRVVLDDGVRVIVKTAPTATEKLLTYELDLVRSEAHVYRLAEQHPQLLMPRVLLTDETRSVLPSDALVVSHLDGVPLTDAGFGPADTDPRAARAEHELGAYMARLHTAPGLAWARALTPTDGEHDRPFGYPNAASGLVGRTWTETFTAMVDAVLDDAPRWGVELPADLVRSAVARHRSALADVTQPALVHTDLWAGNLFVDAATGEIVGVIDPERAFWGDPLHEVVGADCHNTGPVNPRVLAGYASVVPGGLDVTSPSARTRLALYRTFLTLILLTEITPRAFDGDWVPGYRAELWRALDVHLAALA
ncbi:phosphotransferase family protein [Cellulomonas fimi]|uniref:phosphotransferase family protein n=1 Tax=Cellulomonas fimi TaxID=1708 RepID=UPI0003005583|nr:aminoglycoside phosphotransferase family protein [Cellulomonas fimi]NNH06737.1 aminoglycoside phosphotransferase family protein [Cellulomonas fimi]